MTDRIARVTAVVESLERELELLCLTGVEDRLQDRVRPTLELLRNAGVKIWMLTGDKLETATCIAKSSHLVGRSQGLHVLKSVQTRTDAHLELNQFRRKQDCALVVSGDSLEVCLQYYQHEFMELATLSQFVIHRGLIISTMQAIFSAVFYLSSVSLYQGFLMVGYATIYTMFPVFSLVLDQDISETIALTYPELYKELSKGRSLSYKTFFMWVLISLCQGEFNHIL